MNPESGVERAYFAYNLDLIKILWFETAYFTFLHFYMGVFPDIQNLGLRRLILSTIWT